MNIERLGDLTTQQLAHGRTLDLARWVSVLYETDGRPLTAAKRFEQRWPRSHTTALMQKAAVTAGTTTDSDWGAPLSVLKPMMDAYLALVRPGTLIGRIQRLRKAPFNVSMAAQTTGGSGDGWVGAGAAKPVVKGAWTTLTLAPAKVAGILVVSKELVTLAAPGSEAALRDELVRGLGQFLDGQLVDPAVAAVANVSPASLTNGITPIAASGSTAAALLTDVKGLISEFVTANPDVEAMVLLMTPAHAVALAIATNSSTLGIDGGTIFGIPVVTSASVGARIVALDAQQILVADDGGVALDVSQHATIEMDDAPDNPTDAGSVMTSLWASNLVGIRAERWINYKRARTAAVHFISGAAYV